MTDKKYVVEGEIDSFLAESLFGYARRRMAKFEKQFDAIKDHIATIKPFNSAANTYSVMWTIEGRRTIGVTCILEHQGMYMDMGCYDSGQELK